MRMAAFLHRRGREAMAEGPWAPTELTSSDKDRTVRIIIVDFK